MDLPKKTMMFKALVHLFQIAVKTKDVLGFEKEANRILENMKHFSRNEQTQGVNEIILQTARFGGTALSSENQMKIFEKVLRHLEGNTSSGDRLFMQAGLKMAHMYQETKDLERLEALLVKLKGVSGAGESDAFSKMDPTTLSSIFELFSIEIWLALELNDMERVRRIDETIKSSSCFDTVISDSSSKGIIKETNAKVAVHERQFKDAEGYFLDAFKAYQETNSGLKAKSMLLCSCFFSIVNGNMVDQFQSNEAMIYKEDPGVACFMRMRKAYDQDSIEEFTECFNDKSNPIKRVNSQSQLNLKRWNGLVVCPMIHVCFHDFPLFTRASLGVICLEELQDDFLRPYAGMLLKVMQKKKLLSIIESYRTISVGFLASELLIGEEETLGLVSQLIKAKMIKGKINKVDGFVRINRDKEQNEFIQSALAISDLLSNV